MKVMHLFKTILVFFLIMFLCKCKSNEGAWYTYRSDNNRSAITRQKLEFPLYEQWKMVPSNPPQPSWPIPADAMQRMYFDNAFHVTGKNQTAYYSSAVDSKVIAVNIENGENKWEFYASGPVRYAPSLWKNKLYFGSDDGYVYCLKASNGKLIWKYKPGPKEDKILGNGHMISRWPVRTSILVDDGRVFFGAGLFPYEGLYICALDANTGKVIWKNDNVDNDAFDIKYGGISPQGYILTSENKLYITTGRAMPAAFDKQTGDFLYMLFTGKEGGSWATVQGDELYAGVINSTFIPNKEIFDETTGERKSRLFSSFGALDMIVTPLISYILTENGIFAINREEYKKLYVEFDSIQHKRDLLLRSLSILQGNISEPIQQKGVFEAIVDSIEFCDVIIDEMQEDVSQWKYDQQELVTMVLTHDHLIAAGKESIVGLNCHTGSEVWKKDIDGSIYGISVIGNSVIASSNTGEIYCFGAEENNKNRIINHNQSKTACNVESTTKSCKESARDILKSTGIYKGYCLVLDFDDGGLAYELASQSDLKIIGLENNKHKLLAAKKRFDDAGLLGSVVSVADWKLNDLPDYFADLIVSGSGKISSLLKYNPDELFRVMKPYGGTLVVNEANMQGVLSSKEEQMIKDWYEGSALEDTEQLTTSENESGIFIRGGLEGAGSWTHQYGNPANSGCSDDYLVKTPLNILWFGQPGEEHIVDRHSKSVAPLAYKGKLYVQGEDMVMAFDSYNGTKLWEAVIPGANRVRVDVDGGNMAINDNGFFIAVHDKCLQLHPNTGELIHEFTLPQNSQKNRRWGYLAVDGNFLYGSSAKALNQDYNEIWKTITQDGGTWTDTSELSPQMSSMSKYYNVRYLGDMEKISDCFHYEGITWRYMTDYPPPDCGSFGPLEPSGYLLGGDHVFAYDISSKELAWTYSCGKVAHITISKSEGRLFLAESAITPLQRNQAIADRTTWVNDGNYITDIDDIKDIQKDIRMIISLDDQTGKVLWKKPYDLSGCGRDAMGSAYKDGILLFFSNAGLHDKYRYALGELHWHRILALSSESGEFLWSKPLNYMVRPIIIDSTVIIEPRACNLYTGEIVQRIHPITGTDTPWEYFRPGHGCGVVSASKNTLFYRSYNMAFYDLVRDEGITYFGGIRPGCMISMISADGLALFPEAASGCACSFPIKTTVVMKPAKPEEVEYGTIFISHAPVRPVKELAVNFGYFGDRRDKNGTLWFGYPRFKFPYGVKFNLNETILDGLGYYAFDFRSKMVEDEDIPWLYSTGCLGVVNFNIPLIDDIFGEPPAHYSVSMGFISESKNRTFDIKIQDSIVSKAFNPLKVSGNKHKPVVKTFENIYVDHALQIEFIPVNKNSGFDEAPVISFIKMTRSEECARFTHQPQKIKSVAQLASLLADAEKSMKEKNYQKALSDYHILLHQSIDDIYKLKALEAIKIIRDESSLTELSYFLKGSSAEIWDKEPTSRIIQKAHECFLAIAEKLAVEKPGKALRMLQHNASLMTNKFDTRNDIIAKLEHAGYKYDEAGTKNGYITRWYLAGPFGFGAESYNDIYVNEPYVDLSSKYEHENARFTRLFGQGTLENSWQGYVSQNGMIDLSMLYYPNLMTSAYAYSEIEIEEDKEIVVNIYTNNGFKFWFNRELYGEEYIELNTAVTEIGDYYTGEFQEHSFTVLAKKGNNEILIKSSGYGIEGDWAFEVKLNESFRNILHINSGI